MLLDMKEKLRIKNSNRTAIDRMWNSWLDYIVLTAAWLAQLVERQSAAREVEGSNPRPDEHSGS